MNQSINWDIAWYVAWHMLRGAALAYATAWVICWIVFRVGAWHAARKQSRLALALSAEQKKLDERYRTIAVSFLCAVIALFCWFGEAGTQPNGALFWYMLCGAVIGMAIGTITNRLRRLWIKWRYVGILVRQAAASVTTQSAEELRLWRMANRRSGREIIALCAVVGAFWDMTSAPGIMPQGVSHFSGIVRDDYMTALLLRAERGIATEQHKLGWLFESGQAGRKDAAAAARWYRKAADQGYAPAQSSLARCYDEGNGVPQDSIEAARWYSKAAAQGDATAVHVLDTRSTNKAVR